VTTPHPPPGLAATARQALESSGGWVGIAVAAAPTAAFVAAAAIGGLGWAFVALAVVTPIAFGVRIARRESVRAAVLGLVVAAVCAGVAAFVGDARAFFLVPTLIPVAGLAVFLGSLVIGRPLAGVLLNRAVGGPRDWRRHPALRRVYVVTTWLGVAFFAVNAVLRIAFYRAEQLAVLTVLEVAAAPVGLALLGSGVVAARRVASPTP
jgi:hypothetical protein